MDLEIVREQYQAEWDRRDHITSMTGIPFAVISALAAGLLFLFQSYPYHDSRVTVLFVLVASAAFIALGFSVFFIIRSIYGFDYQRIPTPKALSEYHESLIAYFQENLLSEIGDSDQEFRDGLARRYAEAVEVNAENNRRKSAFLHLSTRALIVALCCEVLAAVPAEWAIIHAQSAMAAQSEKSKGDSNVADPKCGDGGKGGGSQPSSGKPQPPPNQIIKEGDAGKKR